MLQSIYKVFWTNILGPMKGFLGWKHISKDVCGCYFQAAHLVRYIHNSMSTYLLRCFVSKHFDEIGEMMASRNNVDVLCHVASEYWGSSRQSVLCRLETNRQIHRLGDGIGVHCHIPVRGSPE